MLTLHSPKPPVTVRGVLVPVAWAPGGDVTGLAVATFDEKEFRLEAGNAWDQWRELLNRMVSVDGIPYEQDGVQWLHVRSLRSIES